VVNKPGFCNNGATYDTPPTLSTNILSPTTQATIGFYFETTYKLYIANKGSNYVSYLLVSVEAEDYTSFNRIKMVDSNIDDFSNIVLGFGGVLSGYTNILGGVIRSATGNGDTLLTSTNSFSSAPIFSVVDKSTQSATVSISSGNITADSTLSSISLINSGLGYNLSVPPVVTITTLAGNGSGAVAKATVGTSSSLSIIYITKPGKKYVKNVNDFRNDGTTGLTSDNPSYPGTNYNEIKPGDLIVQDVYYGTGYQIINQTTKK